MDRFDMNATTRDGARAYLVERAHQARGAGRLSRHLRTTTIPIVTLGVSETQFAKWFVELRLTHD